MLVVNVAGFNFAFKHPKTKKQIIVPYDGRAHNIPDDSPTEFVQLIYLTKPGVQKIEIPQGGPSAVEGKPTPTITVNITDDDLKTEEEKKEDLVVEDVEETFKTEIKMDDEEVTEEEEETPKPVAKKTAKKTTKKLSGKKISTKKRKEISQKKKR